MRNILLCTALTISLLSCNSAEKKHSQQKPNPPENNDLQERVASEIKYQDSLAKAMHWKPIHDGLYISKFGDIGFKTAYVINPPDFIEMYITKFCCDGGKPFKDVIDPSTFRQIGGDWGWGGYFKDKNHIYHFFGNSDGGNLSIVKDADYATFEIVSDCYGRDKNHIYDMRFGLMEDIDPKEFKILGYDNRCLGKYKDKYYWGSEELTPEDLAEPDMKEAIKRLDKL